MNVNMHIFLLTFFFACMTACVHARARACAHRISMCARTRPIRKVAATNGSKCGERWAHFELFAAADFSCLMGIVRAHIEMRCAYACAHARAHAVMVTCKKKI